ncbi:ion channel [Lithospermum erythrorhizon]|uniref:Ion channel n=1 Tax=Lithospermum erythrorhizon TaxID=34254 RepID=A0AAV3QUJ9_LITER
MANATNVNDPLLPSTTADYSIVKNALKRRRLRRGSSDPNIRETHLLEQQHTSELLQNAKYTPENKFDLKPVYMFLAAYLGLGAFCFFLVRDQIDGRKKNGMLDAIYFCVVTMTTVGYGDLIPRTKFAKFLACIFVFTGMALVGFVLSNAADYILEKQEILFVKAIIHKKENGDNHDLMKEIEANKIHYKVLTTLGVILFLFLAGIFFLYFFEDLELFDAFYCVCSTVTTLGYGDKSFSTKTGRLFAAVWILISTICWAQFFYYLAQLYTERRQRSLIKWVLTRKLTVSDLDAADLDDDRAVSAAEFVVYKLKELGKISDEDVSLVMDGFRALDVDSSGTLTENDLLISSQ